MLKDDEKRLIIQLASRPTLHYRTWFLKDATNKL